MANPFEIIIQKMIDLGFYNFLFPFIISSAIFYALLKRSRVLGESIQLNAIVALALAFMIFGFPIIAGVSLASPLSSFFTQATVWLLVVFVGMLFASFFYPDLFGFLSKTLTTRSFITVGVILGIVLMITSGLVTVFTGPSGAEQKPGQPLQDVILIVSAIIIFATIILIASALLYSKKS